MNQSEANDQSQPMPMIVVVLDGEQTWLGTAVDDDAALTLWATMSEDPANWDEVAAYWPRYRCPGVCEFLDGLPFRPCDRCDALQAVDGHGRWLAIDLTQKRVIAGVGLETVGRDATLAIVTDENGNRHCPLPIHLPPWWELHESASAEIVKTQRENEVQIPRTNRTVLFGSAMVDGLASRILQVVAEGRLPKLNDEAIDGETGVPEASHLLHALTVEVHRDWLMTSRTDLRGRCPRELLHGSHHWSGSIIDGQRLRFETGAGMIAAPDDLIGYDDAPMGREEMIIYFDVCREVIQSGWFWCQKELETGADADQFSNGDRQSRLAAFLADVRDSWLQSPFEGGSPASFIVECSRRRVPRGSEVPIQGMDGCESPQHLPDCDCPICDMMASEMFGVGFTSLDGHHLELDEEFAFSTHEFFEDWQREQDEYRAFSEKFNREQAEREARLAAGEREEDVYASAWSSPMTDGNLPGDPNGYLKLSFRLAEIMSDLECLGADGDALKNLNLSFRDYRQDGNKNNAAAKEKLQHLLNEAADRFPGVLPKVADFQSQLDERERAALNTDGNDWLEDQFPF
ncbi:hypothetical protein NHH03_17510 [Stieleria sp. TO1_6]|uniref:hypothetical protein n=1 Tax=Stieleria tagensis TaxID=2956795 RepID=UPI00209A8E6A|nr:hypothetical protein [Stieleria tagensis]MCO8123547.1 hypothetical protein [Stieleria tagensis]